MDHYSAIKGAIEEFCGRLRLNELCDKVFVCAKNLIENHCLQSFVNSYLKTNKLLAFKPHVALIRFVYGSLESQLLNSGLMPVTVTNLLKVMNVRACEFLKRMRNLQDSLTLSNAVFQHLVLVQKKFLISCPLYKKFEKMHEEIFYGEKNDGLSQDNKDRSKKYLCWLLFVSIKSIVQHHEGCLKLAESFHLLLCCMEYIIQTSPSLNLLPPFGSQGITFSTDEILSKLCQKYGANLDEVKSLKAYYFEPEAHNLSLSAGEIDTMHLLDMYMTLHKQIGDINELDFLEDEFYLTTHCLQPQPVHVNPAGLEDTPVGQAMVRIQGLKNAFKITASHPSPELLQCFNGCLPNPLQLIIDGLQEWENLFVSAYGIATRRKGIGRSRFRTSVSVYYDVMGAMLALEIERLSPSSLSSLLNKAMFHKSLIACSLELVLHAYEFSTFPFATSFPTVSPPQLATSNFAFPWILHVLDLKSFDFFKLIESLIQVKPNLPNYLKEHLLKIEDQIISYLGWESDSPVFGSVYTTNIVIANSDMTHLRISSNEFASQQNQSLYESQHDSQKKSQSTMVFLSKALKRSYHNLKSLGATLGIPGEIVRKIGSCFEYCLQNKLNLFKDRHIDQVLMCCVYGVPKIHDVDVKFKDIVGAYKKLDGCAVRLEKHVLIAGDERGPIILFYNKVFVPELKNYLFMLNPHSQHQEHHSPLRDLNAAKNQENQGTPGKVIFSAASPFKIPLTPKTKTLYCFKDSPLGPLKLISRSDGQERKGGASKKLKFTHSEMDMS